MNKKRPGLAHIFKKNLLPIALDYIHRQEPNNADYSVEFSINQ